MANKQRAISIAVVIALLAGFAWLVLRPHELAFEGKPLSRILHESFWGDRYAYYGSIETRKAFRREPAERAIKTLGTNALPLLLEWAGTHFSDFRGLVGAIAHNLPNLDYLHLPRQIGKHEIAAWGFKLLGPEARPAVPGLIRLLKDRDTAVQASAAECLAGLGPEAGDAVPALIEVLRRPATQGGNNRFWWGNGNAADAAAHALGEIGPAAGVAIPYLVDHTNEVAQVALIKIRQDSFTTFFERIKDTSNLDRWFRTVSEVSRLGTNADPAVPLLLAALEHTNNRIQHQALMVLGNLHRRPELCLPAFTALLKSTNSNLRATTLDTIQGFGPAARPIAPEIVHCLRDHDPWMRQRATNVLRFIDPEAAARAGINTNHP